MDAMVIHDNLKARFDDAIGEVIADNPDPFIMVDRSAIAEVGRFLQSEPGYEFTFLESISGVDLGDRLQIVYHLLSYTYRHALVLKVEVPTDDLEVPTTSDVWPAANWHEREQYDLFGFFFVGHPDLRRIMLPEDWAGHPLRKSYQEPTSYHGISHARPPVTEQLRALDEAQGKGSAPADARPSKPEASEPAGQAEAAS